VRMLEVAPWLRRPGTVIVAQPMRHAQDLRGWLITRGFRIERESACRDAGRLYSALRAVYDGVARAYPAGYVYYGALDFSDKYSRDLLSRELELLRIRSLHDDSLKEAYDDFCARCV